ncbi:hypothetical protein ACIBCH_17350 [Amycolatopsis thailandensis]|uniref:hypothetical protein n=1 Tax=Amycolatopsis thailandensis TaxID=589330 RepID=UPI003794BD3F
MAAAAVAYAAGWTVYVTGGLGGLIALVLTAPLGFYALIRSPRPGKRATAVKANDDNLRQALSYWASARDKRAAGHHLRAGLAYQTGINHLLTHVSAARLATGAASRDDLVAAYHAIGAMGAEGIPLMEQANASTALRFHGRIVLAAAHLADPTGGRPDLITEALAADSSARPDLNGDGQLTAATRIAGAAEARLLLARLMAQRPDLRWEAKPAWLVGSGAPEPFTRERARFRQAMLPSCSGLAPAEESVRLATESVLIYSELSRAVPTHATDLSRAEKVLDAIRNRESSA